MYRGNCKEHPRRNLAQNSTAPKLQKDYITEFSEEIESRVTKKLSQEFSRTESRNLGALSRLDDLLLNPLLQGHSRTTPETSRNTLRPQQGTNEDASQSDPHPEASVSKSQTTQNSGPDDAYDTYKSATRPVHEIRELPTYSTMGTSDTYQNSAKTIN